MRLASLSLIVLSLLAALSAAAESVRPYLQGGPWYPADRAELEKLLDNLFQSAQPPPPLPGPVQGIVAPHAGLVYSGVCAATGYKALRGRTDIRRVVMLGTSHRGGFTGACTADYDFFATPLGRVPVDTGLCRSLARRPNFSLERRAMDGEHSLENQLPFLQSVLPPGFRIVPILFSSLAPEDYPSLAESVADVVDEHTLLVASSDLTHFGPGFGYTPFQDRLRENLTRLDLGLVDPALRLDLSGFLAYRQKTGITACGIAPIGVLLKVLKARNCAGFLADYRNSGDATGDYRQCVSYASILYARRENPVAEESLVGLDRAERKTLLAIARQALTAAASGNPPPEPENGRFALTEKLKRKLGVFVTLRRRPGGDLRGCIGSIVGVEPLYRGVSENAVHAAIDDPRFPAVGKGELKDLEIEISVMTPLRLVKEWRTIRLGRDGVVIRDGFYQAVFLPQVATETGWGLEEFLGQLCRKAGLEADAFRRSSTMSFSVFQAEVFGEPGR